MFYLFYFAYFIWQETSNQATSQLPMREVREWTIICDRRADLQPLTNIQENVDWTSSSRLYSNLAEIPTFISSHRQLPRHQEVNCRADLSQLQGKQLQRRISTLAWNWVKDRFPL